MCARVCGRVCAGCRRAPPAAGIALVGSDPGRRGRVGSGRAEPSHVCATSVTHTPRRTHRRQPVLIVVMPAWPTYRE
ncbi:hypothetical protein EON67_04405 [archaeon]|nr:MAG: hypothetical protein EON67_04405 [archaeon]